MTIELTWEHVAKRKRDALEAYLAPWAAVEQAAKAVTSDNVQSVPSAVLEENDIKITEMGVGELIDALKSGRLSSVAVTQAFIQRATIAHGLVNCLNEAFFEQALTRAKELDDHLAETGEVVGPLHGLPLSLKNQCNVEGIEMNMDYVGWVGRVSAEDGAMAAILRKQGAVLYCLTNMSQALFSSDSWNNLYGRTVNPRNVKLAAGGSSGGEGALIGMRGSPLGVGSDLGGSVRVPAAYNGLYGFRGSWHRMPYGGSTNSQLGQETVPSVLGPLSTTIDGIKLFYKSVLDAQPWKVDPMALRMPWSQAGYELKGHGGGEKLCFGLQWHNNHVKPNPPYYRAMKKLRDCLIAKGHSVIDFQFPDTVSDLELLLSVYLADGGADVQRECDLSGEPLLDGVLKVKKRNMTVEAYHKLTYQCRLSTHRLLKHWASTVSSTGTGRSIDAVLTPAAPCPSFVPGQEEYIMYTGVSNLHDLPSAVIPVLEVDAAVDLKELAHEFMSAIDKDMFERYDPALYHGMPIGIQVIGQRGEDEAVIRMAEIVDEAIH